VGANTRLLDIACGSGFAAGVAAAMGATVVGLDASEPLLAVARARAPAGDFRAGDMFALPFDAATFDVATSFNGIWKGCEKALEEAWRVLRSGGLFGMTFWGAPKHLGLLPYFIKVVELSPPDHSMASLEQGDTGRPGVVEDMFAATGFEFVERGVVEVVNEWPDLGTAVRAMAVAGPSVPAIEQIGYDAFLDALTEAFSPLFDEHVGLRIRSQFGWATARKEG
jgi:ubiquinone/menaquinone biosynthesis C-methylase UbiE